MTVVIALRCSDGLIVASDSQGTESGSAVHETTRHQVRKVYCVGERAAWGASGLASVITDLGPKLDGVHRSIAQTSDPCSTYVAPVRQVLKTHYDRYLEMPDGQRSSSPASSFLAAGYGKEDEPYIVEVDPNCTASRYDELGFHSIGSGAAFARMAQALMAHFRVRESPLSHGLLVAYRVLDAVIHTSAFGVGGPIQMAVVTPLEPARILEEVELDEIASQVGLWQELERETLEDFLGAGGADEDEEAEPLPAATREPS